jgi:hypothetical protein
VFFWVAAGQMWLPFLAAPVVGYLLFGLRGAVWPLLVLALSAVFVIPIVYSRRRVGARLASELDPLAYEQTRVAVEAAGGADVVIDAALRAADASLELARRAGGMARGQTVSVLLQARWKFARTDDDVGDAVRALALARESERAALASQADDESFNEWLSANGHRFM